MDPTREGLRIGPYTLHSVETGRFRLDGGAMFGTVPKVIWEKRYAPDEKNRIEMALRCLLIEGEGRTILVDCGIGTKWSEKETKIFAVDHSTWTLDSGLAAHGVDRSKITDLILTHLHFDHAGGVTRRDANGALELSFPNARIHLQRENLRIAKTPNAREKASYLPENVGPVAECGRLNLLDGEGELFPGFSVFVSNGHTHGLQGVVVQDRDRFVAYCADMIPLASHVRIPFVMGYDLWVERLLEEKAALLKRAVDENGILFFEHDPSIPAARVKPDDGLYNAGDAVIF